MSNEAWSLSTALTKVRSRLMRKDLRSLVASSENQLILSAKAACWRLQDMTEISSLADVEFRAFSQWGEDGIIEWLLQNVPIAENRFVEFGVENYREANTRFLLQNRNWSGLVLDGSNTNVEEIRRQEIYWRHDLTAVAAFVTKENIDSLLLSHDIAGDIGILSIDIDGNDYWVLEAIDAVQPRILVCEYNALLGDFQPVVVPYRADFARFKAHHSGTYFGASIRAITQLADKKGYDFLGTCSNGVNAFFVRRDLFDEVAHKIKERIAYPARHKDSRDQHGALDFKTNRERYAAISHLPVLNLDAGRVAPLREFEPISSKTWL